MASPDMQLIARGNRPGFTNLAIGEPIFLQDALTKCGLTGAAEVSPWSEVDCYPPSDGLQELRDVICPHSNVVIANGAKQALLATFWALEKTGSRSLYIPKPYWPCFPTLAKYTGLSHVDNSIADVQLLCWPNNPTGYDNSLRLSEVARKTVIDAVYDHEVYAPERQVVTWRPKIPGVVAAEIGSASKQFGLSGLRLGWAVFDDAELAALATEYIETTTSGVSMKSQRYFMEFLECVDVECGAYERAIEMAKAELRHNVNTFNDSGIREYITDVRGAPAGAGGMFAFFSPEQPFTFHNALERAGVQLVVGAACGDANTYRMSLGVMNEELSTALGRLVKELQYMDSLT